MKPDLPERVSAPLPLSYVAQEACKQAVKLVAAVWVAAYLLHACRSIFGSLPLAIALVAAAQYHFRQRPQGALQQQQQQQLARDIANVATALVTSLWLFLDACINALFSGEGSLTWQAPSFRLGGPSRTAPGPESGSPGINVKGNHHQGSTSSIQTGSLYPAQRPRREYPAEAKQQARVSFARLIPGARYTGTSLTPAAAAAAAAAAAWGTEAAQLQGRSKSSTRVKGAAATVTGGATAPLHRSNGQQQQERHRAQLGHTPHRTPSGRLSYDWSCTHSASAGGGGSGSRGDGRATTDYGPCDGDGEGAGPVGEAARPDPDAWRLQVGSKVVEFAWEKLCGGILQTWVYDVWWALLSPDREFPAEVRRLLNGAFGRVAERARRLDVTGVLVRDLCEALISSLELYRATLDHLGGPEQLAARALTHAAQNLAMAPTTATTTAQHHHQPAGAGAVTMTGSAPAGAAASGHTHAHAQASQVSAAAAATVAAVAAAVHQGHQGHAAEHSAHYTHHHDGQQQHQHHHQQDLQVAAASGAGAAAASAASSAAAAACAVSAARERLLQGGLRAVGGLHPAFEEPDGHYRVLREVADALVGVLWPGDPLCCGRLRPLLRELLSTCVLRPVMCMAAPGTFNRLLHGFLPALPDEAPTTAAAPPQQQHQHHQHHPSASSTTSTTTTMLSSAPSGPSPPPPLSRHDNECGSTAPSTSTDDGHFATARGGAAGAAVAARAAAEAEAVARAASEASLEFERRVTANADAEAALLRRLARSRGVSAGDGSSLVDRSLSRTRAARPQPSLSPHLHPHPHSRSQQQLSPGERHPLTAAGPPQETAGLRHSATAAQMDHVHPPHTQHQQHRPDGAGSAAAASSGGGGGGGGGLRKSASSMELRSSTAGAVGSGDASSDGTDGGAAAATAMHGGHSTKNAGGSPPAAAAPQPPPQGMSVSYHAGMERHAGGPTAPRQGHCAVIHALGASAGASPEKGPTKVAEGARSQHLPAHGAARGVHRRSCSYDTAAARSGGGGQAEGDAADAGSGGCGGGGLCSSHSFFKGSWFEFDLTLPWRPDAPPPPNQQHQHLHQHPERQRVQESSLDDPPQCRSHSEHPQQAAEAEAARAHHHRSRTCDLPHSADASVCGIGAATGDGKPAPSFSSSARRPANPSDKQPRTQPAASNTSRPPSITSATATTTAPGLGAGFGPGPAASDAAPMTRRLRASVAAFEMVSEPLGFGLTAEYVVYKIRVAEAGSGREWTVARRFRSFEALAGRLAAGWPRHRAMVQSLPPKRIFVHTADVAFVNSRRAELDAYLQLLLGVPELAGSAELREFLQPDTPSASRGRAAAQDGAAPSRPPPSGTLEPRPAPEPGAGSSPSPSAVRNLFERVSSDLRDLRRNSRLRLGPQGGERPPSVSSSTAGRAPGLGPATDGAGGNVASSAGAAAAPAGRGLNFNWFGRGVRAGRPGSAGRAAGATAPFQSAAAAANDGERLSGGEDDITRREQSTTESPEALDVEDEADVYDADEYDEDCLVEREASTVVTGGSCKQDHDVGRSSATPHQQQPTAAGAAAATSGFRLPGLAGLMSGLPFARSPAVTEQAEGARAVAGTVRSLCAPSPDPAPRPLTGGSAGLCSGNDAGGGGGSLAAGASRLVASLRDSGGRVCRGPQGGSNACGDGERSKGDGADTSGNGSKATSGDPSTRGPATPLPLTPALTLEDGIGASAEPAAAAGHGRTQPVASSGTSHVAVAAGAGTGGGRGSSPLSRGPARRSPDLPLRPSIDNSKTFGLPFSAGTAPLGPHASEVGRGYGPSSAVLTSQAREGGASVHRGKTAPNNNSSAAAGAAHPAGSSRIVTVPNTPIAAQPAASSLPAPPPSVPAAPSDAPGPVPAAAGPGAAAAAAAGVSAPLYELIDVLFGLQGQGFFRRQVITVTRQMLSLLAGDAIDHYVSHQLRHLTSEHTLARALLMLHGALFPGGAWYSFGQPPQQPQQPQQPSLPSSQQQEKAGASAAVGGPSHPSHHHQQHLQQQNQQQQGENAHSQRSPLAAQQQRPRQSTADGAAGTAASGAGGAGAGTASGRGSGSGAAPPTPPNPALAPRWRPSPPISAEAFLEPAPLTPEAAVEAQQIAERVRARLFARSPAMLVNVVGAKGYGRVLDDVWGMMQSRTMLLHLAYSLLTTLLMRLFPELQPRLRHLQPRGLRRAAGEAAAAAAAAGKATTG